MSTLVTYSDSSSDSDRSENDDVTEGNPKKIKLSDGNGTYSNANVIHENRQQNQTALPLPNDIKEMFDCHAKPKANDDMEKHSGRIRSFEHVEGDWATYIYVPYKSNPSFMALRARLFDACLSTIKWQPVNDHHISLSRTVAIRHHWMEPLMTALRQGFRHIQECMCELQSVNLFTNDEKTRSFLVLTVSEGAEVFGDMVSIIDDCFLDYKLPAYYKDPSFHMSIGWTLGDVTKQFTQQIKDKLQVILDKELEDNPEVSLVHTSMLHMRAGQKLFNLPLQPI